MGKWYYNIIYNGRGSQNFYVAFVAQNADVDYYLDDITLEELN